MLSKIYSATTVGLDGVLIRVEVDVYERGFPTLTIVGLPDKAVEESKERVRTAIKNSGFEMPDARIVVNLAPADIHKEGAIFDLPIALGILASSGAIEKKSLEKSLFIGELSLDGNVNPVSGVLPIIMLAREKKLSNAYVPLHNAQEAAVVKEISVYPLSNLADLTLHLNGHARIKPSLVTSWKKVREDVEVDVDFCYVKGQEKAKRALEICAAGGHNIHLKGPPGAGKSMLAQAFAGIIPLMGEEEIFEVSKIYSIAHQFTNRGFVVARPYRAPHHTISRVGLIGGGARIQPGEISLAHRGVLFLDEFPEFPRSVIEALRQPMEDGWVTVSRASGTYTFPSRFILVCASNPCPCGYLGHPKKICKCGFSQILKYKKRLSGPILDRIDLHVEVPPVEVERLMDDTTNLETSVLIRQRVEIARKRQKDRFSHEHIITNAEMTTAHIKKYCVIKKEAFQLLKQAIVKFSLSARAYFKTVKVAQTIVDLRGGRVIDTSEILEALQYRCEE